VITPAGHRDAGELLTLQRAAFVGEARLYGDLELPPLTETLDQVRSALTEGYAVKATVGSRIVGSARARVEGPVAHLARFAVAPDQQGLGIGTRLITALEAAAPAEVTRFALFTGERSERNLALYERLGYHRVQRRTVSPEVVLIFMEKPRSLGAGESA